MPVVAAENNPNLSHLLLTRSDSLRSSAERSDGDLSSVDKRVSFNNDVKIKCIPKKSNNNKSSTASGTESHTTLKEAVTPVEVHREAPPVNPDEVEAETQKLLQQLEGIECSASKTDPSINAKKQDNRLYGLHALNNLDIAVNGKEVNSMPSYQEIRRNSFGSNSIISDQPSASQQHPASGIPVLRQTPNGETPPKPPRKNMTHYAQPAVSGINSDIESVSSDFKRYQRKRLQEQTNEDSAIASGDADDSTVTSSYTSRFLRRSPQRQMMSPSRTQGNMTDSEILRSPTEVLYAVSEKHRHRGNELMTSAASQTTMERQSERSMTDREGSIPYSNNRSHNSRPPPPRAYVSNSRPRSTYNYSSREDLVSNDADPYSRRSSSENHRYKPKNHVKTHHSSRSLDRLQHNLESDQYDSEANKENAFKTRIQVISPERQHMIQNGGNSNRKPYKTTINTATDNILYRGTSTDNLQYYHYGDKGSHYKVPKSARPVIKNNQAYDNGSPYRNSLQRPPSSQQQQFQSTRLIKNMDNSNGNRGHRDPHRDRGMMMRNRHYSGHSTSPEREGHSPERGYNRQPRAPPRSYIQQRSPSSSPTRPPRSRSSPTRESAMVRRVNSRRGEVDRSPSVMTSNTGTGRRGHSGGDPRGPEVDRSPSVMQSSGGLRERSRDSMSRRSYISPVNNANAANGQNGHSEAAAGDRLSKFTEYRGEDMMMPHAQDINQEPRRPTQTDLERERVRGQSLPPGATIENIRDFYKSSQYKSMYQLPPSPTRPAPVLERGSRTTRLSPSAGPRVSISEGDVTDESSRPPNGVQQQGPPEKMPRHHRRPVSTSALRPSSSKRQAPSPPVAPSTGKGLVVRRVVSSDGRASSASGVSRNVPMPAINSNVQKAPSMRRIVVGTRRSSVDNGLDSSFSESEGPFNGETEQPRPWSSLSDDDLEDEIEYVLAVTNGIVDGHLNEDPHITASERPLSGIMSTTSSRPSTSATIVHVHSQPPVKIMPAVHRDPSIKRIQNHNNQNHSSSQLSHQNSSLQNSVVFHENPTSYHTIIKDKQPLGEFGRRWTAATPHSDIDSDYRRDLATSSTGLHQEARSRDGGQVTSSWAGGRLSRGSSKNNVREEADIILRSTTDLERSNSNSAREEERRKVLEIEGVIRQPQTQLRANVTRSASRASRTAQINNAGPRGYKPGVPRHLSADVDRESQYSGHSSSQTVPLPGPAGSKLNRFDQHRVGVGRVRRSTSNANAAAMGGVRQQIQQRKTKLPGGSLTSSINSSESEQGSHAGQSAVSRNTARSNRSVFLHAAAVADIPSPADGIGSARPSVNSGPSGQTGSQQPSRSLSAESRDNLAVTSGTINAQTRNHSQGPPPTNNNSNLKGSKKISRSISLLAPWKPRPELKRDLEINYDNGNLYANPATRITVQPGNMPPAAASNASSKPPRPPTAPPPPPPSTVRRNQSATRRGVVDHNSKSASSSDLLRDDPIDHSSEDTTPAVILAERKAAQTEAEKRAAKVSRSMSMPKDSRLAGWFKKRKRIA